MWRITLVRPPPVTPPVTPVTTSCHQAAGGHHPEMKYNHDVASPSSLMVLYGIEDNWLPSVHENSSPLCNISTNESATL